MKHLKNKVLVLGSTGMLGHQVVNYLINHSDYEIYDTSYRSKLRINTIILDVTDKKLLFKTIIDLNPNYIVNCIGDLVEINPNFERAIYLNSLLPHLLKKISKVVGFKLIHISTDCVFSGKKGGYEELDDRDGIGLYAETKKSGEIIDESNLTLRSSIIGPELKSSGKGLFQWFITQESDVQGYTNSIWSGVTTIELAKSIKWAIDFEITGLYHITNGYFINKYELLKLFKKYSNSQIHITPIDGKSQDKSFVDTRKIINYKIPSYEQMVMDMILDIKSNHKKYNYKNL
jgi:dTDP-4-dehydrorhamnose reductase